MALALAALLSVMVGCATHAPEHKTSTADVETHLPARAALALSETDAIDSVDTQQQRVTIPPPPIWERIRQGFTLMDIEHPRIDQEIRRLRRAPGAITGLMLRAQPYLHHILDEIEVAGLPTELVLLPGIESGYRPFAYSPDGAAGLWQFMPSTGRMMGLQQDWWLDKRRTVRASTSAAIQFLARLNDRFKGDWLHTLAAYNAGSAKVGRAIRKARKRRENTAFWALDLPGETDRYVPRLLALAHVVQNPEQYGVELPDIRDEPYFAIAQTAGQIDLTVAAGVAGMPIDDLIRLNAGHRRWATSPDGPHELLLPMEKVVAFETAIDALPKNKRLRWMDHTVERGESLNRIARDFGVTVDAIRRTNNMSNSRIKVGQKLKIPLADSVTFASAQPYTRQRLRYRVRKGDSLYTIARRFDVSVRDLKRWNRVGRYIRPGERLTVFVDPDA